MNYHRPHGDERIAKLNTLIQQCTYPDHLTTYVQQAVQALMNRYDGMDCEILSFNEYGQQCRLIEVRGKVPVNFKGSMCGVKICLMIPQGFPNQPPGVRIMNDNPSSTQVDGYYASFESPAAPHSYVISNLPQLQQWQPYNTSLAYVVEGLTHLMSERFPFKKRKNPLMNKIDNYQSSQSPYGMNEDVYKNNAYPGSAGFNQPQNFGFVPAMGGMGFGGGMGGMNSFGNVQPVNQFGGGMPNQFGGNQYQYNPPNNIPAFQSPHYAGFSNPQFEQMMRDGPNSGFGVSNNSPHPATINTPYCQQAKTPNYPNFGGNPASINTGYPTNPTAPPLNRANSHVNEKAQLAALQQQAKSFVSTTTQQMDTLKKLYQKRFTDTQRLHTVSRIEEGEINQLKQGMKQMSRLIQASEQAPRDIDVNTLIVAADQSSRQLLQLDSSLKAWSEASDMLQSKFNSDQLSLPQLLKLMRRIEQERFTCRWMLRKWVRYAIEN